MELLSLKPYDYFDAIQTRYNLLRRYPFISAQTIGKSVMGREITAFFIGDAKEYSLFVGGIHGSAHFTAGFLYTFFSEVCDAFLNDGVIEGLKVKRAFDGRGLIVIPCLNPDGCEIAARGNSALYNLPPTTARIAKKDFSAFSLNARGVDINKIFSTLPQNEPESCSLKTFLEANSIRHIICFDKGDNKIILPSVKNMPKRSNRMAEIMLSGSSLGVSLRDDNIYEKGISEWFSEKYFKPAFTVLSEINHNYIDTYKALRELMMLCAIM